MNGNEYRLTFDAWLDNGVRCLDPVGLRALDGVQEDTDLAEYVLGYDLPGIELLRARPVLRFDEERSELYLEVVFVTSREVTDRDRQLLARFWRSQREGGWGSNYWFRLPERWRGYAVRIGYDPRERVPNAAAIEFGPLIARYAALANADVDAMSTEQLTAIQSELEPLEDGLSLVGTKDARAVLRLWSLASARLSHRAADRAGAGIPKVHLDNLDALDDLPGDLF